MFYYYTSSKNIFRCWYIYAAQALETSYCTHCSSLPYMLRLLPILSFSVMHFSLMKHIDVSHELSASFFRILFSGSMSLQNGGKFTLNRTTFPPNNGNLCFHGYQILKYQDHNICNLPGGLTIKVEYTNKILM